MNTRTLLCCAAWLAAGAASLIAAPHAVLLISVDGLRPDYVTQADRHGLKIPHLRALMKEGLHATAVRGVLPTVTYSSHTTLVTGVSPAKHGIPSNHPFDPTARQGSIWYWYAKDIQAPTLWQTAAQAGLVTGNVMWPVTVGADFIRYNMPEYARTRDDDDLSMLRGLTTPGLYAELEKKLGAFTNDVNNAIPRDWVRTRWAAEMIRSKKVRFMTLHLASTDHTQHEHGPFTPSAIEAVEAVDQMLGVLREAILTVDPGAAICIVSDHGFSTVSQVLKLNAAFVREGLITLKSPQDTLQASGIAEWKAMPWESGGSAAVVLKDPKDEATRARVAKFLDGLASVPANGIARILDRPAIAKLGGSPQADFWVDLQSGFGFNASLSGPLVMKVSQRGTHGYSPENPELRSFFLIAGQGIRKGADVGEIDMRSIAPTVAKVLGVRFDSAEAAPVKLEP